MDDTRTIEEILENFPYHRKKKNQQKQIIAKYTVTILGNNQKNTSKEIGIDREMLRRIKNSFKDLTPAERIKLVDHAKHWLPQQFKEQHSEPAEA